MASGRRLAVASSWSRGVHAEGPEVCPICRTLGGKQALGSSVVLILSPRRKRSPHAGPGEEVGNVVMERLGAAFLGGGWETAERSCR